MLLTASKDEFFRHCDAIEGINGRGSEVQNLFSHDLGGLIGARMTGGSDAHRVEQLGTAATRFERRITNVEDLVRELKAGRFHADRICNSTTDTTASMIPGDGERSGNNAYTCCARRI